MREVTLTLLPLILASCISYAQEPEANPPTLPGMSYIKPSEVKTSQKTASNVGSSNCSTPPAATAKFNLGDSETCTAGTKAEGSEAHRSE